MLPTANLQRIIERMRPVLAKSRRARARERDAVNKTRPDREGTTYLAAHLSSDVVTQLKVLAARERVTQQQLLADAVDLLLASRPDDAADNQPAA